MRNTKPEKNNRTPMSKKRPILSKNMQTKKTAAETWDWLIRKGLIDDNHIEERSYSAIDGAWAGQPCFIIGSGPPLKDVLDQVGWEFFRGRHTIGINHTIEEWDGFEWFFFLDLRFMDKTTYDMTKFKGKIFAQATTGLKMEKNQVIFHCAKQVAQKLGDGLYDGNLSGLAALNLAIISGADPIYLIGFGMGSGGSANAYHYRPDYTGEVKSEARFKKFQNVLSKFRVFRPWANKIIHVTPGNDIPDFQKMRPAVFAKKLESIKVERGPLIGHFSFSSDLKVHAEITRHVVGKCYGRHFMIDINKHEIPDADLYFFEHFLSTDVAARNLPVDIKAKTIDIVHTAGCYPTPGFLKVIAITESWQKVLKAHGIESQLIRGGIDLDPYGVPSYEAKTFGRMTRWSPGKIHPEWNRVCAEILDEVSGSKCMFFVDKANEGGRPKLQKHGMIYSDECKIDMNKAPFLQRLSVYVHANGSFKETMSHSCIEAMACGLPVVYLTEKTGVLEEVVGAGGIRCEAIYEIKPAIIRLLNSPAICAEIGSKGKAQARLWDKDRMVREYDALIGSVLERRK